MATVQDRSQPVSALSRAAPLLCAIVQILIPLLPLAGIGQPIGDQSDGARTLITPAGWAFSIWGALYTGTLVFAVYQALPARRDDALLKWVRWPAAGAFLGNGLWALYTQSLGLGSASVAIILFTLLCLLHCFRVFANWAVPFTGGERWCVVLPLSALASWLTVASIVNIAATLRYYGIEGDGAAPLIAAAVLVVAGIIVAAALISARGNPPYAIVFLWALAAIYAASGRAEPMVAGGAGIAAILAIGATLIGLQRGGGRHWFGTAR
ncbi:hypothetical protein TPR58_03765 [Sphingomonas sp. HF-S3]|uniref:Tryptophan-rich sensory protein n=1 Tax=Sphingomonas rustica TaxID=3103142 RepID=A0ABV0B501_9SPHN